MHTMDGYSLKPEAHAQRELPCAREHTAFLVSLSLVALCLGAVLCTASTTASASSAVSSRLWVEVCGDIAGGTWTAAESPYYITCDSTLLPGAILTIEHGVKVQFGVGVRLLVSGTLSAIGTPAQPITFTSVLAEPAPGNWDGLSFVAGSSDSRLAWCVVEYATIGALIYAGPDETVSPVFSNCTVRHNSQHGMLIEGFSRGCAAGLAQPTITSGTIEDNGGCGIFGHGHGDPFDGCDPPKEGAVGGAVSGSVIRQNQEAGICLHSERDGKGRGDVWIAIEANIISSNSGPGLHLDGDDPVRPHIENNLICGNAGAGLLSEADHEETELFVVNNTVATNLGDGVVFGRSAAQVRLTNNIVVENGSFGFLCLGAEEPQLANNDLWGNDGGNYNGCEIGPTDISADPLFFDRAAGDFHLRFGSLCIDAGTSDGAPTSDIEGIARPQGEEVDIGAHEFGYKGIFLPLMLRH